MLQKYVSINIQQYCLTLKNKTVISKPKNCYQHNLKILINLPVVYIFWIFDPSLIFLNITHLIYTELTMCSNLVCEYEMSNTIENMDNNEIMISFLGS